MNEDAAPARIDVEKPLTPAMAQYHRWKVAHPDCLLFFRMGDFFELFFDDAKSAASAIGLTLTSRSKGPDAIQTKERQLFGLLQRFLRFACIGKAQRLRILALAFIFLHPRHRRGIQKSLVPGPCLLVAQHLRVFRGGIAKQKRQR